MSASLLVRATTQATALCVVSCLLAQVISAYTEDKPLVIDWVPVFQFVVFTIINTPPNMLWGQFLEETFPAYHISPTRQAIASASANDDKSLDRSASEGKLVEPRLNVRNTLIKTVLDQTVGATLNTLLFLSFMHAIKLAMPPPQTATAPASGSLAGLGGLLLAGRSRVDVSRVDWRVVWARTRAEFWSLIRSGWTFWPFVSLVNFAFVRSLMGRNLVGSLAGMAWTVYVSMFAAQH